jgi:hypothetical protein
MGIFDSISLYDHSRKEGRPMNADRLYNAMYKVFTPYHEDAPSIININVAIKDKVSFSGFWKRAVLETDNNAYWIAWECFIECVKEIAKGSHIELDATFREVVGLWFESRFGDPNVALTDSANFINDMRNNEHDDEKKEEVSMDNITCKNCGCIIEGEAHEVNGEFYCDDCFDEKYVTCAECGEIIERDDAHECDGDYYCDDCFDDLYAVCDRCGDVHLKDDMTYIDDAWICDYCRDRYYTQCERCGEWVRRYDTYTVAIDEDMNTEEWCESCMDYNSWTCDGCDERFSEDVPMNDDCLCPRCSGDVEQNTGNINDWRAPRGVRNYSYKPDPCMCKTLEERSMPNLVFYGFELEVDKAPGDIDRNEYANVVNDNSGYTYVKHDGSLDDGMEIVSHPATLAYHMMKKDTWSMIFDELLSAGFKSHDAKTCGLHVHISKQAMEDQNPNAINNMLFLMDHYWDKLVKFSRRTEAQLSHWARRYSEFHGDYADWKKQAKSTRDRYYALNLQNAHTVEIRMFRGTLNLDTFIATLQLVDTLVRRCIEITDLRRLQSISWEELVQSDWPELNQYLIKRGLAGTPEQIAAAEEEERRKEEEARKAEEERQRQIEEARRREQELEALQREERDRVINSFMGHRVRITSAPDYFSELVGHHGRAVSVRHGNTLPLCVDFSDELPEGYRGAESHRALHGCWSFFDPTPMNQDREIFWFCPVSSVVIDD